MFIDTEAKSLYNVIEIFEKKIIYLSFINEEILEKLNEHDISTIPEEFLLYFKDIIKLNKLYEHSDILKNYEDDDKEGEDDVNYKKCVDDEEVCVNKEHHDLVDKIKKYCIRLCNIFNENESLYEILNKMKDKENHDFSKFLYIIKDIKNIFQTKFQTSALEKMKGIENMNKLKDEEKKIQEEEKKLNEELENIRKESHKELNELEQCLKKKEKELEHLKKSSQENLQLLLNMLPLNDTSDNLEHINMLFEKTKNIYENKIKLYQDQEISLVKKNKLLELDIENYINLIDEQIKSKDDEIEKWTRELKKNKITEKDLDSILLRKQNEENERCFLHELTEKRNMINQKKDNINNEAAVIIQSYIRAVKERNLFSEHEKKKKSRKKKK
ncbi:pre-mRNA splicing factor, putative [Plasmodium reichenowi]|uniref:Dynein regulatory complex protein 10 n=1 Tax=Plasmodium reichenowi TaxID=5854 RepID=A0A060RUC2_PLARE|nr:pre-mRNA splicing factor, putative [Plasmodium reichenowi]